MDGCSNDQENWADNIFSNDILINALHNIFILIEWSIYCSSIIINHLPPTSLHWREGSATVAHSQEMLSPAFQYSPHVKSAGNTIPMFTTNFLVLLNEQAPIVVTQDHRRSSTFHNFYGIKIKSMLVEVIALHSNWLPLKVKL